jgi:hypothetical protein
MFTTQPAHIRCLWLGSHLTTHNFDTIDDCTVRYCYSPPPARHDKNHPAVHDRSRPQWLVPYRCYYCYCCCCCYQPSQRLLPWQTCFSLHLHWCSVLYQRIPAVCSVNGTPIIFDRLRSFFAKWSFPRFLRRKLGASHLVTKRPKNY